MKKKLLSFLLIFSLLATLTAALPTSVSASSSGTCGDALYWELNDEGTLIISGSGAMYNWDSSSNTPWYSSKDSINSVIIGNNVTSIGVRAFRKCDSLTSVTLGSSVETIEGSAFSECGSLTSITIPNSMTRIDGWVFWQCVSLTDVYYTGSKEQWDTISIVEGNEYLTNATIHYNYIPTADGNTISFNENNNMITVESTKAISKAELLVALYKDSRLVEMKSQPISIAEGSSSFYSPITDYTDSDAVKIMIWDSITGMKPLFDCCD